MAKSFTHCSTSFPRSSNRQSSRRLTRSNALRPVAPVSSLEALFRELPTRRQLEFLVGFDALDTLTRDRAGYPFAELCPDLQQAVLSLVASRDLVFPGYDLALWLEDLRREAALLDFTGENDREAKIEAA